jgi:hypothetical protein
MYLCVESDQQRNHATAPKEYKGFDELSWDCLQGLMLPLVSETNKQTAV